MIILKIFGVLFATLLIFVGIMFLVATVATTGFKIAGVVLIIAGIAFLIIIFKGSKEPAEKKQPVTPGPTIQVDLPGNAQLKEFSCKNCGASIKSENVKLTDAGSIMITCPYCKSSYEVQEEPKW